MEECHVTLVHGLSIPMQTNTSPLEKHRMIVFFVDNPAACCGVAQSGISDLEYSVKEISGESKYVIFRNANQN